MDTPFQTSPSAAAALYEPGGWRDSDAHPLDIAPLDEPDPEIRSVSLIVPCGFALSGAIMGALFAGRISLALCAFFSVPMGIIIGWYGRGLAE